MSGQREQVNKDSIDHVLLGKTLAGFKLKKVTREAEGLFLFDAKQPTLQREVAVLIFSIDHPRYENWICRARKLARTKNERSNYLEVYDLLQKDGWAIVAIRPLTEENDHDVLIDFFITEIENTTQIISLQETFVDSVKNEKPKRRGTFVFGSAALLLVTLFVGMYSYSAGQDNGLVSLESSLTIQLKDKDWKSRRQALQVLGKTYTPESLTLVGPMIYDAHWRVRLATVKVLEVWGRPECLPYVRDALLDNRSKTVRKAARKAKKTIELGISDK